MDLMPAALAVVGAGCVITIFRRVSRIVLELEAK
jgi:hypothetical protein